MCAVASITMYAADAHAESCELHVFPTDQFVVANGLGNFGLLSALTLGRNAPKEILARDLSLQEQTRLIAEIASIDSYLKLPPSSIVAENVSVEAKLAKKQKARLTSSAAACYAELVTTMIIYTSSSFRSPRIGALFFLRRFDAEGRLVKVKQAGGSGKLTLYPAKDEAGRDVAVAELRAALKMAFIEGATKFIR